MNSFKITYNDGTSYNTSANGLLKEFTAYLMQAGGVFVDENPLTGKETRRIIAKVEQIKYQFCVLVENQETCKKEFKPVHPTNGLPYEYDTFKEAEDMMQLCYGEILDTEAKIIEVLR